MIDLHQRPCWVFDMDGTLTEAQHDFDAIRAALDIPAGHMILEYLATLPAAEARPRHERLQAIEADLVRQARLQPGCRELLEHLRACGCRMGILTRNSRANALATLHHTGLAHCFDAADVLGRDESRPKPDPDGIEQLLRRWAAAPQQGVMVGDHEMDLRAGRSAGVLTVHLHPPRPAVSTASTFGDHAVANFSALAALVGHDHA